MSGLQLLCVTRRIDVDIATCKVIPRQLVHFPEVQVACDFQNLL